MNSHATKDTVASEFVWEALQSLRHQGFDPEAALAHCGIDAKELPSLQRVPAQAFSQLWLYTARVLDDEFFALDRRRMKAGTFAALCHNATLAPTLGEAMRSTVTLINVLLDEHQLWIEQEHNTARLCITSLHAPVKIFAHETALVLLYGMMCWLADKRIPLIQANFAYARPARAAEYEVMFSPRIRFHTRASSVEFSASHLASRIHRDHDSARAFLHGAPLNVVVRYRNSQSVTTELQDHLRQTPPTEWPHFEEAAHHLGLSPVRLRRQLQKEGQSFQQVKDSLRRSISEKLLGQSNSSLEQIAAATGFSDVRAFRRAFRGWTGFSPSEFRKEVITQRKYQESSSF